jgi:hypothetical protein
MSEEDGVVEEGPQCGGVSVEEKGDNIFRATEDKNIRVTEEGDYRLVLP